MVYAACVYSKQRYWREKRCLEDKLASLVVVRVDFAKEAGTLVDCIPAHWQGANLVNVCPAAGYAENGLGRIRDKMKR